MDERQALQKMYSPGMRRPKKRRGGVIQIHVTRACNFSCFHCTQGSNLRGPYTFISPEHFEQACLSLRDPDYFGTVGVFGGNPCVHPQFDLLCEIMRKHIPYQQRGLWANALNGHGAACRETFNPALSNLNVHLDEEAYKEFQRDWPESKPFGLKQDSRHSPVYVALQDVVFDEEKRWLMISECDINIHWSAMICVFREELRGYFCEIAGSQAMLHQHEEDYPDLGTTVEPGWWQKSMDDFADQVRYHCHRCGVPLRGYGELACAKEGKEQVSITHSGIYQLKKRDRKVELVTTPEQLDSKNLKFTEYLQGANK